MYGVNRLWEDAAGILETASAVREEDGSEFAILVDPQNNVRIVDASGWQLDALRREYQASTAYCVKRNAAAVVVEAQSGSDHCTLRKTLKENPLAALRTNIPYHLVHSQRALLA